MQIDTIWYRNQHTQHNVITVPTRTILHPRLEVNALTDFHAIPKSVCTRTQAKKHISTQPICLTDYDYNYIIEGPLTIVTLSNCHQSQPHLTHLMKYTRLFLTE